MIYAIATTTARPPPWAGEEEEEEEDRAAVGTEVGTAAATAGEASVEGASATALAAPPRRGTRDAVAAVGAQPGE